VWLYAFVDRLKLTRHTPNTPVSDAGKLKQVRKISMGRETIRMRKLCDSAIEIPREEGYEMGVLRLHRIENKRYSLTNAPGRIGTPGREAALGTDPFEPGVRTKRAFIPVSEVRRRAASGGP
jgi:hypothetical protein